MPISYEKISFLANVSSRKNIFRWSTEFFLEFMLVGMDPEPQPVDEENTDSDFLLVIVSIIECVCIWQDRSSLGPYYLSPLRKFLAMKQFIHVS